METLEILNTFPREVKAYQVCCFCSFNLWQRQSQFERERLQNLRLTRIIFRFKLIQCSQSLNIGWKRQTFCCVFQSRMKLFRKRRKFLSRCIFLRMRSILRVKECLLQKVTVNCNEFFFCRAFNFITRKKNQNLFKDLFYTAVFGQQIGNFRK